LNLLKAYKISLPCFILLCVLLCSGLPCEAADKENCLMCHKYRFIGRIDEDGRRVNYNVDGKMFTNSTHRNVPCRDCHTDITKLPHEPVTVEVNCANECHIKPPFSTENFSHKKIVDAHDKSVHGIKPDDSEELKKAKPYCKYCHLNPLFMKVEDKRIDFDETLLRCLNCHEEKGVTQAYKHITHRLRRKTSRSPQEIVHLCAKCHEDLELMSKFDVSKSSMESVETYNRSIHGKAVALGSTETADCVSCHATTAIHDIYKKDDEHSMVNEVNLEKTCRQCHEKVNEKFIQIDVHSSIEREEKPFLFFLNFILKYVLYVTILGLMTLLMIETYGRKKDGIKWQLRKGTTWRG
jgi:hypothetical protein